MQGVVFAAGEGTRLRPLTEEKPKGLVRVAGEPILSHCFGTLSSVGVDELVVVVGYRGEAIVEYYGDSFDGLPITYAHQHERTGLAHALLTAEEYLNGDFVGMNGDNVFRADLTPVIDRHEEANADATLLVEEVTPERARQTGVIEFDDEGEIAGLVEKPEDPPSCTVPRGFYAFSPRIVDACHRVEPGHTGEYELTAAIDVLCAEDATVTCVPFEGECVNVNTPEDREAAEQLLGG